MNRITGMVLIVLGLLILEPAASAQSNCKDARGILDEVFDGVGSATGTLTNGGWLNGTTVSVFSGSAYPTPDPNEVTFASMFTLTTNRGQLKGINRVYLYDLVLGWAATMVKIDPVASTGIFAGATGVLYIDVLSNSGGITFHEDVGGRVCFAQ